MKARHKPPVTFSVLPFVLDGDSCFRSALSEWLDQECIGGSAGFSGEVKLTEASETQAQNPPNSPARSFRAIRSVRDSDRTDVTV